MSKYLTELKKALDTIPGLDAQIIGDELGPRLRVGVEFKLSHIEPSRVLISGSPEMERNAALHEASSIAQQFKDAALSFAADLDSWKCGEL